MTQFAIRHCRLFGVQRPSSGRRRRGENFLESAEHSGRYSLQILLCLGVDAIERFLDVLDRVRHAEEDNPHRSRRTRCRTMQRHLRLRGARRPAFLMAIRSQEKPLILLSPEP